MQQRVDRIKVVQCEQERISKRTVEQTDMFVPHVGQTMELADIPVLHLVDQLSCPKSGFHVQKNIVSQQRQPLGLAGSQTSEKCVEIL